MGRKIIVVLAFLLSLGCLAAFLYSRQQQQEEIARYARLQTQAAPLEQQLSQLQKEMEQAKNEYENKAKSTGSVEVVMAELDEHLFYDAFPQMQQYGLPGVILLGKQWPDEETCISTEQLQYMLDAGWTYVLCWSNEADWLRTAKARLQELGLEMPAAVYFPAGEYSDGRRDALKEQFSIFLHHGETGKPMVVTKAQGDTWELGVGLWDYDSNAVDIRSVGDKGTNRVYEVTFTIPREEYDDEEEEEEPTEDVTEKRRAGMRTSLYDYEIFDPFLGTLSSCVNDDKLVVTSLEQAWELRKAATGRSTEMSAELEQLMADYEAQMRDLEAQIDAIYADQ